MLAARSEDKLKEVSLSNKKPQKIRLRQLYYIGIGNV